MRDANDSRFHLLLGEDDWTSAEFSRDSKKEEDLVWDSERHAVRLRSEVFLFTARPNDLRPLPEHRRGAGRDRHGNWYCIDGSRTRVRVTSTGSGLTTDFWPLTSIAGDARRDGGFRPRDPEPVPPPLQLDALVVTADHRLVVFAHESSPRHTWLLVFDLLEGGPPDMLMWPDDPAVPLAPFDAAPHPSGGLWLLDRDNRRLWLFNRHLRVERLRDGQAEDEPASAAAGFHDLEASDAPALGPGPVPAARPRATDAIQFADLDIVSVETMDDDRVLLLERCDDPPKDDSTGRPRAKIHGLWRSGAPWGDPVELDIASVLPPWGGAPKDEPGERSAAAHDIALLVDSADPGGAVTGRLFAVSWLGNQTFSFELTGTHDGFTLNPPPPSPRQGEAPDRDQRDKHAAYIPMRAFTGQGIVSDGTSVWYPSSDRWVPLREQRRARFRQRGVLTTPIQTTAKDPDGPPRQWFDGREPDCVWHRLLLDARIPHGCAIEVESRAARTPAELSVQAWYREPPLRRRPQGSELPWALPADDLREGTWELLFQRARGRYLQLRLTLTGDGTASPTLRALRAWYPRFSYLERYLPAMYREDAVSADFLERFLANAEGTFTTIEDRIAAAQALFDPRALPEDFLPWLLAWFGAEAEVLPDAQRRKLFVKHAMALYRARGTAPGLAMALRLALEPCLSEEALLDLDTSPRRGIRVVEQFRMRAVEARRAGDPRRADAVVPPDLATTIARADAIAWRYREELSALEPADPDRAAPASFPLTPPTDPRSREVWERVARVELGLVPTIAATPDDAANQLARARWQIFLRRRHHIPAALQAAHGLPDTVDFGDVDLPAELPSTAGGFRDWYDYETVVLARARRAHWFTVYLPLASTKMANWREAMARREVAERVIALQKPAHTIFDVRTFWSLFRVGDARVGIDTFLAASSRAALAPAIADASWIGESRLASDNEDLPGVCPSERPVLR